MTTTILGKIAALLGQDVARAFPGPQGQLSADGALPIDQDRDFNITKGSAIALSVAAPGATNFAAGRKITLTTSTDFAHVVTFTGTTLMDGTAGLNTTWTTTAVAGCSLTFVAVSATRWAVVSFNLGTIAP